MSRALAERSYIWWYIDALEVKHGRIRIFWVWWLFFAVQGPSTVRCISRVVEVVVQELEGLMNHRIPHDKTRPKSGTSYESALAAVEILLPERV